MEQNYLTQHIRVGSEIQEIYKLERFIEKICDDYHIYDAYYGNILASATLIFEELVTLSDNKYIDIYFNKSPKDLSFTVKLYDSFLDLASKFEQAAAMDQNDPKVFDSELRSMMMIKMLTDEVHIDIEEEALVLTYYVSGINEQLNIQRIQLLEKYYAKLFTLTKANG